MPNTYPSRRRPAASPRLSSGVRRVAPVVKQVKDPGNLLLLCLLFWLIFYLNMPDNLGGFSGNRGPIQTANILARNIKVGMILVSVYLIARRWSLSGSLVKNFNVGAAAFLVLAPLSAVWSIDPAATILRYISLISVVLVCFAACVVGWQPRRFQQLTIPPLMFILFGSLAVGIFMPDKVAEIGTDISQRNAWHGITHGKNELGMVASMGVIICVNRWLAREGRAFPAIAGAAAAFACLIFSRSNTSLFATIVAVASMVLVMRVPVIRQKYSTHVIVGIAATITLYELVIQNVIPGVNTLLAPIMHLTGKDTTFSARTIIWTVIKEHIHARPILGTGYGAYWVGPFPTSPSYVFVWLMFFYPTEGHNGYLDTINDLGMVGLFCVLVYLICFIRQGLQLMRNDRSQAALYLAILFQEMIINMSESDIFSRTNTSAVFLLATAGLARGLLEVRLPTEPKVLGRK